MLFLADANIMVFVVLKQVMNEEDSLKESPSIA